MILDDPPTHECVALIYQHHKACRNAKNKKNRKDDILPASLRFGHHPSLQKYLHQLDSSQDPICLKCRLNVQDLPGDMVAYARKTLVNLDA